MCFIEENPEAGRTLSFVEKIIINRSPDQKIGIASPIIPTVVIIESTIVFFFKAAIIPKVIPKTIAITRQCVSV